MKECLELNNFMTARNLQGGINIKKLQEHINLGLTQVQNNEDVLYGFGGLHNYVSASKHNGNVLYLITTNKLILIQKRMFGQFLVNINLSDIKEVNLALKNNIGIITIHTHRESFNIAFNIISAQVIFNDINPLIKKEDSYVSTETKIDTIQKLKDLKSLLDEGVLTTEEFETQKQKILKE